MSGILNHVHYAANGAHNMRLPQNRLLMQTLGWTESFREKVLADITVCIIVLIMVARHEMKNCVNCSPRAPKVVCIQIGIKPLPAHFSNMFGMVFYGKNRTEGSRPRSAPKFG